jgi:hypothetical protein
MLNSKRGVGTLVIVLLIIILIAAGVVISWYFLQDNSFSSCPENTPNTLKCSDTDLGSVTDRKGVVINEIDKKTDSCLDDRYLREYSCDCITGNIESVDVDCSNTFNSCSNGICVN